MPVDDFVRWDEEFLKSRQGNGVQQNGLVQFFGDVSLQISSDDPYEVKFESPQDMISISRLGGVDLTYAYDGDRLRETQWGAAVEKTISYHPQGSTTFAQGNPLGGINRFATLQLDDELRADFQEYTSGRLRPYQTEELSNPHVELVAENIVYTALGTQDGFAIECLSLDVAETVYRQMLESVDLQKFNRTNRSGLVDQAGVDRGRAYMFANLDRRLTLKEVAFAAEMNRFDFVRGFAKVYDESPASFLKEMRADRALQWMRLDAHFELTMASIAAASGFSSTPAMRAAVFDFIGVAPEVFRACVRG